MIPDPKLYRFQVVSLNGIPKQTEVIAAFQAVCYPKVTRVRPVTIGICSEDGTLGAKVDLATMKQVHQFTREMLLLGYVVSAETSLGEQAFAAVYAARRFPDMSLEPRTLTSQADRPPGHTV
jgi:hypothetical protein